MDRHDKKYDHLFTPSGDLTAEALWAFAHNGLPADERKAAEHHLAGCELCRDALEGIADMNSESAYHNKIRELDRRIDTRTSRQGRRAFLPGYQRLAVAAILLILIGVSFVWFNRANENAKNIASGEQAPKQIQPEPLKTPSTQPVQSSPPSANMAANSVEKAKVNSSKAVAFKKETIADTIIGYKQLNEQSSELNDEEVTTPGRMDLKVAAKTDDRQMDKSSVADSSISGAAFRPAYTQAPAAAVPNANTNTTREYEARKSARTESFAKEKSLSLSAMRQTTIIDTIAPQYTGGVTAIQYYIDSVVTTRENLRPYTHSVELIIDESGKVTDVKFIGEKHLTADEQAVKQALFAMPEWQPGMRAGEYIKSKVVVKLDL